MSVLPAPSSITPSSFKIILELYPSILGKVYDAKLKDGKKRSEAIERDKWRFEELPANVAAARSQKSDKAIRDIKGQGLSKEAVERLVQWKISHGQSRPFLPAMVRKNEASAIETQTSLAFEKLGTSTSSEGPSNKIVTEALETVCKLNGIGPATGTLILNIFDPVHIPFFQDEMFLWFFPDLKGGKLKYTQKEYLQLLEAVRPVLKNLQVRAVELEKVAYVLLHKELLEDCEENSERSKLEDALRSRSHEESAGDSRKVESPETVVERNTVDQKSKVSDTMVGKTKGRKRPAEVPQDEDEAQSSKRRSHRTKK